MADTYALHTQKYEAHIGRLMKRRAREAGLPSARMEGGRHGAAMRLETEEEKARWYRAVAALLIEDIAFLEVAERIRPLQLCEAERIWIFRRAMRLARRINGAGLAAGIARCYAQADTLNLEGFVRFRAQGLCRAWEQCIREAAEELLLEHEYRKLVKLLAGFVREQEPRIKNLYLVLHPNGGCTLTDDHNARINYASCTEDGILSVLVGLAPEHITVYDLSGGRSATIADVLCRVFRDRVKYYK